MRIGHRIGIVLCCASITQSTWAFGLSDITGHPAQDAIDYLFAHEIIGGYPDGTFKPDRTVNRAELLKILVANDGTHPAAGDFHDCFPDVHEEWFAAYVCYAKERGWVQGYPDGTFRPDDTVNAAEAIKMILAALGLLPNRSSASSVAGIDPAAWYAPYIDTAIGYGIVVEKDFDAVRDITRGDVAGMIYRFLLQSAGRSGATSESSISSSSVFIRPRGGGGGGNRVDNSEMSTPVITFEDMTKTYGDANFTLTTLSNSTGYFTYSSGNTTVATIAGNTVTIVGVGTATITATQAAAGSFRSNSATATLTVQGIAPSITFGNLTKSHIDENFTLSPTSNSPGSFTFVSGNTSLVSIVGSTADIVGAYGTTTITANQAASGIYAAASKTMTMTVYLTYCVAAPCMNGGTCTPTFSGNLTADTDNMLCSCPEGASGTYCEMTAENCSAIGYCNSGECIPDASGGACGNCAPCLTGDRCQTAIINCLSEALVPIDLMCVEERMSKVL